MGNDQRRDVLVLGIALTADGDEPHRIGPSQVCYAAGHARPLKMVYALLNAAGSSTSFLVVAASGNGAHRLAAIRSAGDLTILGDADRHGVVGSLLSGLLVHAERRAWR
jgi:hypothetical protein